MHAYFSLNKQDVLIFDQNSKNMYVFSLSSSLYFVTKLNITRVWRKINKICLNSNQQSSSETI